MLFPLDGIASSEGAEAKTYTYTNADWKDLLTAVNGSPIVYEGQTYSGGTVTGPVKSGNPIRYTSGTKTYTDLTWQHGRQLASLTTRGRTSTFEYDHEGIRTRKIYNSVYHDYITQGGKVVRETVQSADWDWVLDFIYDTAGRPFALNYSYDGGSTFETYYYILNYQGDVVALLDSNGNVVARYTYNAWGEILSATGEMADLNPLRYRGYYYDSETGFYYLQSRYYDPMNRRFINADCYTDTGTGFLGYNMFAYCNNLPTRLSDPNGNNPVVLPLVFLELAYTDGGPSYKFTDDDPIGQRFNTNIQYSEAMKKLVDDNMPHFSSSFEEYSVFCEFNPYPYRKENDYDWELSYSVGDAKILLIYTMIPFKDTYAVSVSYLLVDTYTFEYWEETKGSAATRWINNATYFIAKEGLLSNYSWTCSGTYICFPKEGGGRTGGF